MINYENFRKRQEERLKKRRAILGRQGFTESHFGEQYSVYFDDGTYADVYVWTEQGVDEKNQHDKAMKIAQLAFPGLHITDVCYV